MLQISTQTKIYIYCPAGAVTGGAELLHQMAHILRSENMNAYVVYYGDKEHVKPAEYNCYNVEITEHVEDIHQNIEVIYEGVFHFIPQHKQTQKLLWWLSVDHFYMCAAPYLSLCDLARWNCKMAAKAFLRRAYNLVFNGGKKSFFNTFSIQDLRKMSAMHGYQSEYAQNFLQNKGFGELVALKDYINTDHVTPFSIEGREDIVLYNPKKGMKFTQKLINAAPNIRWVALQNMTRTELVDLMRRSKLYVDFGYHPGKDRLPRECAMNGCCIITGKRGSAAFFEDIAIGDNYKFDEHRSSVHSIIERVQDVLRNYQTAIDDFAYYRAAISREKIEFEEQVKNLFCNNVK